MVVFVKDEAKVASRVGVLSEEFWILASSLVSRMSRNLVLGEFRLREFAVVQEEIR